MLYVTSVIDTGIRVKTHDIRDSVEGCTLRALVLKLMKMVREHSEAEVRLSYKRGGVARLVNMHMTTFTYLHSFT